MNRRQLIDAHTRIYDQLKDITLTVIGRPILESLDKELNSQEEEAVLESFECIRDAMNDVENPE